MGCKKRLEKFFVFKKIGNCTKMHMVVEGGCHKCDISKTGYQDHHQLKTGDEDPRSFLDSFIKDS